MNTEYKKWIGTLLFCSLISLSQCDVVKYPYGQRLYQNLCADCHMDDGSGLSSLYPSLVNEKLSSEYTLIPCFIRSGSVNDDNVLKMLPMKDVSDVEITNIINYILNDMNNVHLNVGLQEVQDLLSSCHPAIQ